MTVGGMQVNVQELNAFLAEQVGLGTRIHDGLIGDVDQDGESTVFRTLEPPNILTDAEFQDECLDLFSGYELVKYVQDGIRYRCMVADRDGWVRRIENLNYGKTKGEAVAKALAAYYELEVDWK